MNTDIYHNLLLTLWANNKYLAGHLGKLDISCSWSLHIITYGFGPTKD